MKMYSENMLENITPEKCNESNEDEQYFNISVKIYKADGIPRTESGIMAQVKKTFAVEAVELFDPYVEVFLGGLKGKTTKKKRTMTPCWNQQIVFTLKFPLTSHPLVVQMKDDEVMINSVIGTAEIPLDDISNSDSGGFLPTFGPSYVYLKDPKSTSESDISYRGRLLMAVSTETISDPDLLIPLAVVQPTTPLPEDSFGQEVDFLLFACIRDVTMIEKRVAEKPLRFSLQIGHIPEYEAVSKKPCCPNRSGSSQEAQKKHWLDDLNIIRESLLNFEGEYCSSFTTPVTKNRKLYKLPILEKKECLWLKSSWPDYRRRMYISNILEKAVQQFELCLCSFYKNADTKNSSTNEKNIEKLLKEFENSIQYFSKLLRENLAIFFSMTELDKERWKTLEKNLEHLQGIILECRKMVDRAKTDTVLVKVKNTLQELKRIKEDPQPSLPDVVMWMENDQKRIGYCKMTARDLLYALNDAERGKHCSKIINLFFKPLPKKKSAGYFAKMDAYLWLGVQKHFKYCLQTLPQGFDFDQDDQEIEQMQYIPRIIHYHEKQIYQLKAHVYQARFLPWSDMSRSPNPVAQIFIGGRSLSTQILENTLSPVWDESLVFNDLLFYGMKSEIIQHLPDVIIEIFNYATSGKSMCLCKGVIRILEDSTDPPSLKWYDINSLDQEETMLTQILAAFEIFIIPGGSGDPQDIDSRFYDIGPVMPIPPSIRPRFSQHRFEVLFWGLRELKRVKLTQIESPRIELDCDGKIIQSSVINDYKRHSNFRKMVEIVDMELPEREAYFPALTIRLLDCKSFGRRTVFASHIVYDLQKYVVKPIGELLEPKFEKSTSWEQKKEINLKDVIINMDSSEEDISYESQIVQKVITPWTKSEPSTDDNGEEDVEDWWSRYHISVQESPQAMRSSSKAPDASKTGRRRSTFGCPVQTTLDTSGYDDPRTSLIPNFQRMHSIVHGDDSREMTSLDARGFTIYLSELENVPEFGGFEEWLHSFDLTRGRTFGRWRREMEKTVAVFKGCFRIYELPLPNYVMDPLLPVSDNLESLFYGIPENKPTKVLIRLYIVEAMDLAPSDVTNTTDAYIVIQLGKYRVSDKENYISKQLNPVFGRTFEFVANFPMDSTLQIQIMDWDLMGSDDLIGETKIDLENRFYSRHRPTCGLARTYETSGPNAWRDVRTPTEILTNRCQESGLGTPQITEKDVRIANIVYDFSENPQDDKASKENMALYLLHRWSDISPGKFSLVPEHLETRTLYHPSKPGEPQGKLVMWIDMFSEYPSPPRDISKRKPISYELRVIIWNTDEVILADDAFFTGEKMSDIYVKGWLTGKEDVQRTDIHYRSLTGEGNFNWRFVFPFDYLPIEKKMVVMKKVTMFSWDETEFKLPPELKLQVFDADHFKSDDFLGELTLDLRRFPRCAKSVDMCNLEMLKIDGTVPQVSLFKQRRVRGWWPVSIGTEDGEKEMMGKIEAELHLLQKEEAEQSPVGLGRKEPDPLPEPKRPVTSFANFLHPFKTFRYAFWKRYKKTAIKIIIIVALILLLLLFLYATPGYTVKKVIGA